MSLGNRLAISIYSKTNFTPQRISALKNLNTFMHVRIKTSGSESRPRKVELASAHKKNATTTASILHITTKLVKTPTKQPYRIYIFIS